MLIEKETIEALDFEAVVQESICWIDTVLLTSGRSDPGEAIKTHSNRCSSNN